MSATVKEAPKQHKQPSRKGKKAWRKNVDLTEVQSGLEDAREEVIQGYGWIPCAPISQRLTCCSGILSEKAADELFAIDTTGSEVVKNDYVKKNKPLKADEIIAARSSAIPALDRTRKRKVTEVVPADGSKRIKSGNYVSRKELERLKNIAYQGNRVQKHAAPEDSASYDPWAMEPAPKDPTYSFIEDKKPKVAPETLQHKPVSLAKSGKPFAAVRKPDAGKSYNPQFEDWQSLLAREGDKEVEAERQRLKQAQDEAERLEKALAEAARPEPASDEEYESAWESEWEGIASEGEEKAWLTKKRPERKTQSERNKIKRRKEAEQKDKWEKQMKKRDEQQARVRQIAAEVRKKEDARKALVALVDDSEESGEEEKLRRRRLGKNPIPDAPLEVVLADELQDSLRALKPEGNLLKDRYRNLLLNGKLEARRPAVHKKPKREVTEKWSYKDWSLKK